MASLPKLPPLSSLPFRLQAGVVAGILGLAAVGGYAGLVMPKSREVKNLKVQLARGDEPIPVVGETAPPISEEERKLWAQLEERLRQRYPAEKDLPGALKAVAELARAARMELVAVDLQTPAVPKSPGTSPPNPAAASAAPGLKVPPPFAANQTVIKLTATHRYRDLVEFLDGLSRLPVAVSIDSLEIRRIENRLTTEMTLRTLRWGAS